MNFLRNHLLIHLRGLLALVLVSLFLSRCANQVAPTGGKKDESAPKVVKANPENFSTQFKGNEIILTFDEYFTLNDVASQIYVSPLPPGKKPDFKVHNKQLRIRFHEPLQENTTYTIYFGNAIRDVNEGNILQNFSYVFSTGVYLDSLMLKGVVSRALDNTPVNNSIVALYFSADDSVIYKSRPDYFSRTNKEGQFEIRNIKSSHYKIIAFEDANQDLKYSDDESLAFIDSMIYIKDTSLAVGLRMFKPQLPKNKLLSAKQNGVGKALLVYANPTDEFKAKLLEPDESVWHYTYNATKDSITLIYNPQIKDSIRLQLSTKETNDTATILFKSVGVRSNKNSDTLSLYNNKPISSNLVNDKQKQTLFYGSTLQLRLSEIIDTVLCKSLTANTLNNKSVTSELFLRYNPITNEPYLEVKAPWQADMNYVLNIPRGCWKYKNGQWNDSTKLSFYYSDEAATGNLNLMVYGTGMNQNFILELFDSKKLLVYSTRFNEDKKFALKHLIPGVYKVRVIADANGNGRYDTGSYWDKRQPEAVIVFPNDINVRANWDLDVELSLKNIRKK